MQIPENWKAFARANWQLAAIVMFTFYQIVAIAQGLVLFAIGNFFVFGGDTLFITTHAGVMLIYKVWQKLRAWQHNSRTMKVVRGGLIAALKDQVSTTDYRRMKKTARRYSTIDRFFYDLQTQLTGYSDDLLPDAVSRIFGGKPPPVSIVAPIYDLKHHEVEMMIQSIHTQVYRGIKHCYLVINDASDTPMKEFLEKLIREQYSGPEVMTKFHIIVEGKSGKRNAQYTGFKLWENDGSEYGINMDGDGFAHIYAVAASITRMEADPTLGLLTGDVRISNWKTNILTRVTGIRYFSAFWDERAAQSLHGQMICGSGPWLVMRREALFPILERWKNFKILGKVEANFGDDRQLTQEILADGWRTEVDVDSVVWTDCPTKMKPYRRQQTRWNKSSWIYNGKMYLEGLWHKLDVFTRLSIAYLTFYPFAVLFAIGFVLLRAALVIEPQGVLAAWSILQPYLVSVVLISLAFQSASGIFLFHDWTFLLAPLYTPLWFWVQLPARPIALVTILDQGWGTRKQRVEPPPDQTQ